MQVKKTFPGRSLQGLFCTFLPWCSCRTGERPRSRTESRLVETRAGRAGRLGVQQRVRKKKHPTHACPLKRMRDKRADGLVGSGGPPDDFVLTRRESTRKRRRSGQRRRSLADQVSSGQPDETQMVSQ